MGEAPPSPPQLRRPWLGCNTIVSVDLYTDDVDDLRERQSKGDIERLRGVD